MTRVELAPVVIGVSLKMYFNHRRTVEWSKEVAHFAPSHEAVRNGIVELVVLPSFPSLAATIDVFSDTPVRVGAQDLFWADRGPFTGEVSGADLAEIGCDYVEVGHAERRRIFGESDEIVADKVAAALRNGLAPILCVGEAERTEPALAAEACIEQLRSAFSAAQRGGTIALVVVAYEPEWAIGADASASPSHIREVCELMRDWLLAQPFISASRVIYGGSAGPGLLSELGGSVDGLFLGRFAHDPMALNLVLDEALHTQRRTETAVDDPAGIKLD
jgi:triosephosphate isomerase